MFCRFCGAGTPSDSRFCPKCGKRLAGDFPRTEWIARRFALRTPYPWAGMVFLAFLVWAFQAGSLPGFDYGAVRLSIELEGRSAEPSESLYRHHFSFVVENVSEETILEVPVELRATIDAAGPARVESDFLGRRLTLVADGRAEPIIVVLTDDLDPGGKRRYAVDGLVTAAPPFRVRYELLDPVGGDVLSGFAIEEPAPDSPGPAPESAAR